ncbi:hypothetical protein VCHA35O135_130005 [Vibrio chagasii]|nr:hypothetical protein VCHA35O135_130005 [Vibrio chagasii]
MISDKNTKDYNELREKRRKLLAQRTRITLMSYSSESIDHSELVAKAREIALSRQEKSLSITPNSNISRAKISCINKKMSREKLDKLLKERKKKYEESSQTV